MNFTREPIIETVMTPKEGYKLVIRNSKGGGQEEFFVDAVEVISFGNSSFFRSLEKPKSFLVPVNDYEVLEVRESRMVLKATGTERGIKIGGGRETAPKIVKEEVIPSEIVEQKVDKRRERRRTRKRRGKEEGEEVEGAAPPEEEKKANLIPPPTTLISESIARYKGATEVTPEMREKRKITLLPPPPLVEPPLVEKKPDEEVPF